MKNYRTNFTSKSTTAEIVSGSLLAGLLVCGAFAIALAGLSIVPALVAGVLMLFFGLPFWPSFGAAFAIQLIVGFFKRKT